MGVYERIRELYEEERARQQRETELLRAASRVADALHAHGVEAADAPIRGWLIHKRTLSRPTTPPPPPTTRPRQGFIMPNRVTSTPTMAQYIRVEYRLGVDGKIYDGPLCQAVVRHPPLSNH